MLQGRASGVARPTIAEQVVALIDSGRVELPTLPEAVARVLELLHNPDESPMQEIARTIECDPGLAATLLRVANSAMFLGLSPVRDVQSSVDRLGVREVAALVMLISNREQYRYSNPARRAFMHALWNHALASALASRGLASRAGADPSDAFLGGLLHDVGKLVLLRAVDQFESNPEGRPLAKEAWEGLIQTLHPGAGHRLLRSWRLPESACRSALRHHDRDMPSQDPLLLCVRAANRISRKIGMHPQPEPKLALDAVPELVSLAVVGPELGEFLEQLGSELDQLRRAL